MTRYRKLGYVELNVSDLPRSRAFYEEMVGLQFVDEGPGFVRFRCDSDPYSVVLHQAAVPGYKCAGLMLEDERQFDVLHECLRAAKVAFEELPADVCARKWAKRITRMVEPYSGATLEFYVLTPDAPRPAFQPTHTKIQRLGHIVFTTPQATESTRFFLDVLNFRVSDAVGEFITFMRPFPSPYHHGLGVARGPRPLFHHLNLMVTEFDDIGRGLNRCNRTGVPIVFGPGRHVASGSAFLYYLDPDGITLEYSFGMEEFPEVNPRAPNVLPPKPESIDTWGAPQDPRFATVGEIERHVIETAQA